MRRRLGTWSATLVLPAMLACEACEAGSADPGEKVVEVGQALVSGLLEVSA
jgi:hypothetical protein